MKSFFWDLLILIVVSAVVAAIMLLPRQKAQADKVLDTLVKTGLFNGEQELTHSLRKVGGSSDQPEMFVWSMVYERNYREALGDEIIKNAIQQLHAHVYLNQHSTVELVDEVVATDDATEKIDQDWGSVFFDSPIGKRDASLLAQSITTTGGYTGSIHMIPDGKSITYRVQRDPASHEVARSLVAEAMQEMVLRALPDERVQVVLVDRDLKQFEVLVEPLEGKRPSNTGSKQKN